MGVRVSGLNDLYPYTLNPKVYTVFRLTEYAKESFVATASSMPTPKSENLRGIKPQAPTTVKSPKMADLKPKPLTLKPKP